VNQKHTIAITLSLVLLAVPSNHAFSVTELVTNGSFESPNIPTGTFSIFASIPGWSTTFGGGIEIQDNVAGAPAVGAGDQFVELDSTSNSGMAQTLSTAAGVQYQLSFIYSPRPGVGSTSNVIEVYWNGNQIDSITGAGTGSTVWMPKSYQVTATGSSTVLEFRAAGTSDSLGGYIDTVSVIQDEVVGGNIIQIDSAALLLAGAQSTTWMIPVVLSIVGIGLFVVSRKPENS